MTFGETQFIRWFSAVLLAFALAVRAQDDASPFVIVPTVVTNEGQVRFNISFRVPPKHRLYADALLFEMNGQSNAFSLPQPTTISDKHSRETKRVFEKDFVASRALDGSETSFAVSLHGCNDEECFFPETRRWLVRADHSMVRAETNAPIATNAKLTDGFEIAARTTGFQGRDTFLNFLAHSGGVKSSDSMFAGMGLAATIGLILLGGLALNLTPCVLPMIPINLAILGAGTANRDRRRGFALGGAYGAGMSLAYGGLGFVVVLTGAKFGALNSSPWFNFGIAVVFVVLGFAMLDKLAIDFSRF